MIEEKIEGRPKPIPYDEKLKPSPLTKQPLPQPASNESLMSSANRAIEQMTAKPTSVRHQLGHGVPANHEVFQ